MFTAAALFAALAVAADPPPVLRAKAAYEERQKNPIAFDQKYRGKTVDVPSGSLQELADIGGGEYTLAAAGVFATLSKEGAKSAARLNRLEKFTVRGTFREVRIHDLYGYVVVLDDAEPNPPPAYEPEELAELARRKKP